MKKQRTKGIVLVVVCFICVMCICSGFHKAQSEELSEIPDAVNSTRFRGIKKDKCYIRVDNVDR